MSKALCFKKRLVLHSFMRWTDFYARYPRWWAYYDRECPWAFPFEIEDHVNFRWLIAIASFIWHVWRHTREFIVPCRGTIIPKCSTFRKSAQHSSRVCAQH